MSCIFPHEFKFRGSKRDAERFPLHRGISTPANIPYMYMCSREEGLLQLLRYFFGDARRWLQIQVANATAYVNTGI